MGKKHAKEANVDSQSISMKPYRVEPDTKVKLDNWDPNEKSQFDISKDDAAPLLAAMNTRMEELQELLYA